MNEKLQELTRKIYDEGLEKGKKEAAEIIEKAQKQADSMLAKAKAEAQEMLDKAATDAAEQKKNLNSELTLASKQAVATVKQKLAALLNKKAVEDAIGNAFDDKEFVKTLITKIVDQWSDISKSDQGITVFLSESDKKKLEEHLLGKVGAKVKQGLDVDFEEGIKSGFRIGPADQSFKLSFTDKDFESFFMQFLRPRTQKFFNEQ